MTCLGNEFWSETYISEGSEGRAGHLEGQREPGPRLWQGLGWSRVRVPAHHVLEGVLEAGSAGGLDCGPELRALLVLAKLHLDDHHLRALGGLRPCAPSPRPAR